MAYKQSSTNEDYEKLPSSVGIYSQYDFGRRYSKMTVRWMYDADGGKGINLTRITDPTLLKSRNFFWPKLL